MKKINETEHKEKSVSDCARNTFDVNQFDSLGGNSNGFTAFDYAENRENFQCQKCHPPLVKPRGELRLCEDCQTEAERTAVALLDNFTRHRKVIKLDCFCFCCEKRKTAGMMAKLFPVCRKCFDELKSKGATAQGNFLNRATNNFFKQLKGALTI